MPEIFDKWLKKKKEKERNVFGSPEKSVDAIKCKSSPESFETIWMEG